MHEMQETRVWPLSWEYALEEDMATHPSILAWEIPWTEKPPAWVAKSCTWLRMHTVSLSLFPLYFSFSGLSLSPKNTNVPASELLHLPSCYLENWDFFLNVDKFESLYWICYKTVCFTFCFLGMWDPSSPNRDWTCTPCTRRWNLKHWITREVPPGNSNLRASVAVCTVTDNSSQRPPA